MSNKKTVLGAAVALAVVAYGGGTWYMGQRAQSSYQEAVAELRELLGAESIVSDEYRKGFFSSQARLVLQWTPPGQAQAAAEGGAQPVSATPAPQPLRLVVDSTVRHGPLAGARLAAAVVDSRFALEGLDAQSLKALEKVTAPTLTSVHHFTGGHDIRFLLPAGEIAEQGVTLRWQEMASEMAISAGGKHVKGSFRWPEAGMTGLTSHTAALEEDEEEDGEDPTAAAPSDSTSIVLRGMEGTFDNDVIEGLWAVGPGGGEMRIARLEATTTPAAGGEPQTIVDLKDMTGSTRIDATDATLGMATQLKGAGRIGPIEFESVGYEEKIQRIDIETIRSMQRVLVESYRSQGVVQAAASMEANGMDVLMQSAPRLVAALPAYSMKLQATYQGQTGHIEYGAEVQQAPAAGEVEQAGWAPALLKGSLLHASVQLPKAWLLPIMQSTGKADAKAEDVEGLVGMAQASGYVRQEGDNLTSALKMQAGQLTLNGKPMPLPMGLFK